MVPTSPFPHFSPATGYVSASVSSPKAKEEEPPEAPEGLVTDETEEKESDRVKAQGFTSWKKPWDRRWNLEVAQVAGCRCAEVLHLDNVYAYE